MPRDRFVFLENFKATADLLDNKNKLAFYDAVCDYIFKDIEPTDPYISALLNSIKPSLNRVDGRCNNGGNHNPTGKNQHTAKLVNSGQFRSNLVKQVVNSGQSLSDNIDNNININNTQELDSDNTGKSNKGVTGGKEKGDSFVAELERQELSKTKTKRFTPPTLEEVKAYCLERRNGIDPQRFISSYESKGWMVGKSPMKDWKAAVRTWERSGFNTPQKAKSISSPDYVGEGSFLRKAEDDPFCADL